MKRIYSIDFLKLVFAILIALAHDNTYIRGAGYDYTKDHIKQLYPHYLFSLIILIVYIVSRNILYTLKSNPLAVGLDGMLLKLYNTIPEFFLLQNSGFYDGGMNYPLWQICNILIVGYFLYALLSKNEKFTTQIICPLSIILVYTLLYTGVDQFGRIGAIYVPLLRALAPMCLGIILYKFTMSTDYKYLINKNKGIPLNILSVLSLLMLFTYEQKGYVFLILFVFVILELFNEKSWINKVLNRKIFKSFGDLSYAVYLNHALIIYFVNDIYDVFMRHFNLNLDKWQLDIVFVIILLVYSIITMNIVKLLKDKVVKKKNKMQQALV